MVVGNQLVGVFWLAWQVADQQSAMFGECCFLPGDVKLTMGTGGFWNINTGGNLYASKRGKLVNICSLNISCYLTAVIDEDTKKDKIWLRFAFCF